MTSTSAGSAKKLAERRHKRSRLGVVLAGVALLAQIVGPRIDAPVLISSADGVGKLAIAFDGHALCLAPDSGAALPPTPARKSPRTHHDFAGCCIWHGVAGAVLTPAALVEPVAFSASRITFTVWPDNPTRLAGAVRARGSPAGA